MLKIYNKSSTEMSELDNDSVQLIVTSPPYPMIKMWNTFFNSVGAESYEQMHRFLGETWAECYRVLQQGGIACINIGDAVLRHNNIFQVFPNHSKIMETFSKIGFITLPYILWKKPITRPNAFLGSGFYPTNAYITLDCEYILIFRKGDKRRFSESEDQLKHQSGYSKEERNCWFSQIWTVAGAKQNSSFLDRRTGEFPDEIPKRLIRMFSIKNDIILDPFLGTGTTLKVARELERNGIGYEIDENLFTLIRQKLFIN